MRAWIYIQIYLKFLVNAFTHIDSVQMNIVNKERKAKNVKLIQFDVECSFGDLNNALSIRILYNKFYFSRYTQFLHRYNPCIVYTVYTLPYENSFSVSDVAQHLGIDKQSGKRNKVSVKSFFFSFFVFIFSVTVVCDWMKFLLCGIHQWIR